MLPIVKIPLFKPGTVVEYQGYRYTVNFVTISNGRLKVTLHGLPYAVLAEHLLVQLTTIDFNRGSRSA